MPRKKIILLLFSLFFLISCTVQSEHTREYVDDNIRLLHSSEKQILDDMLQTYEKNTTNEIVILIISSLNGEDINKYATRMHNLLRVGKIKYRNGVLIVVAREDRKVRISVGYGLINSLPNDKCRTILDNYTIPLFKKGQYFEGLEQTIDQIKKYAKNDWGQKGGQATFFKK